MTTHSARIALVTGANKGLGHETARQLVAEGCTVYAAARSAEAAEAAAAEFGARPIVIDVTDDASVAAAARRVEEEQGRLDVLVNNAGISTPDMPITDVTSELMTNVLDTNVVGIVRMLQAFLPLVQRSDHGVVVNVGSGLGSFERVHDTARAESKIPAMVYCTSKSAVSMLTVQYARLYPDLHINVVDPGPTATALNGFRGFQTVEQGAAPIVRAATIGADGPTGAFLDAVGISPW